MKTFSIFIEDLQADKEEFDALADVDMGNNKINHRVTDLEVAHGMALITVSFEFECYMDIFYYLNNTEDDYGTINANMHYDIIKNKLSRVFNTNKIQIFYNHSSKNNEFKISNSDYWFIEPDGSLKDSPATHIPVEIISPWIPAKDAVKFVTKFRNEVAKEFNVVTNSTTSMHCSFRTHIRDKDKKIPLKLNVLKLLALLDEDAHLERFNRSNNIYTKPIQSVLSNIKPVIDKKEITNTIKQIEQLLKKNDKYNAINFKDFLTDYNIETGNGRMEIRIIGDDYMGSLFKEAMYSINEFILLVSSAIDNNLHDKEFNTQLTQKISTQKIKMLDNVKKMSNAFVNDNPNFFIILKQYDSFFKEIFNIIINITDFSLISKIEKELFEFFKKLAFYINIKEKLNEYILSLSRQQYGYTFWDEVYIGNSKYTRLNAIFKIKYTHYNIYNYLRKWYTSKNITIKELNTIINSIKKIPDNDNKQKIITDCIQVINNLKLTFSDTFLTDLKKYENSLIDTEKELILYKIIGKDFFYQLSIS